MVFFLFCFFYLYWGNVVMWLKRTSTKNLANRISYRIWYKGYLKDKFGREVQIRCDTGSKSISSVLRTCLLHRLPKTLLAEKLLESNLQSFHLLWQTQKIDTNLVAIVTKAVFFLLFLYDSIVIHCRCDMELSKIFCVLYVSINLMLRVAFSRPRSQFFTIRNDP